jgi:hypothetical protein
MRVAPRPSVPLADSVAGSIPEVTPTARAEDERHGGERRSTGPFDRVCSRGHGEPVPAKFLCPCCELTSLAEEPPGTYEICGECEWEDDPVQFADPDYRGGANGESLREARAAWRRKQEHGIDEPTPLARMPRAPSGREVRPGVLRRPDGTTLDLS